MSKAQGKFDFSVHHPFKKYSGNKSVLQYECLTFTHSSS